jgi:hypothetical protein
MSTLVEGLEWENPHYKVEMTVPSFKKAGELAAAFKKATNAGALEASQLSVDTVAGSDARRVTMRVENSKVTDALPPLLSVMGLVSHALAEIGVTVEKADVKYISSQQDRGRGGR